MDAVTSDPAAWPAPAKLNRMLRIVGRRADGYHLLQTVFQFLERGDRLWFEVRDDGAIEVVTDMNPASVFADRPLETPTLPAPFDLAPGATATIFEAR